jgi:hypothetical protein
VDKRHRRRVENLIIFLHDSVVPMFNPTNRLTFPPSFTNGRYPAFDHLFTLGLMHLYIDLQASFMFVHRYGLTKLVNLPPFMLTLFLFSSLLGITTIVLAFISRSFPLIATTISAILYTLEFVLLWLLINRFHIPQPSNPRLPISPFVLCAIIIGIVVIKSLRAAIKQNRNAHCLTLEPL